MPEYIYRLMLPDSRELSGLLRAQDAEAARIELQRHGILLTIEEVSSARKVLHWVFPPSSVDDRTLHLLTRELASLLGGGIPLARGLSLLKTNFKGTTVEPALLSVEKRVLQGEQLHRAMARHPEAFPPLYVAMVEAGENAGRLVFQLRQIAAHYDARLKLRTRVQGLLAYPLMVLAIAGGVLAFFMVKVIPTFAEVLRSLDVPLPFVTRFMMGVSAAVADNVLELAIGGPLALAAAHAAWDTEAACEAREEILESLPALGEVYRAAMLERFFSLTAMLASSGVSLLEAIALVEKNFSRNPRYARGANAIRRHIVQGRSLTSALRAAGVFPELAVNTIAVSEEAGSMVEDMGTLSDYYRDRFDFQVSRLMTILEPALVLGVGGLVGLLLFSLFMPLFQMSTLRAG